ncbi:folylpolyglutamate synthase, mitochondrial isoform X1 [Rhopalosiphum padi]|uniref:folylpolyglutamate synthase, mitochondrial isoform X1 n=1 Tax=Rhopalosiphum padi TaxID=40932 RepID=UPI00298E98F7|nr:folylpolyglutamate synthase, mitochondrial isoform X1 [Rhopalosiphum padi]
MSTACVNNCKLLKSICLNISGAIKRRKMSINNNDIGSNSYDDAVKMLNSLQSFTSKLTRHPGNLKLGQVNTFLNRCGVSYEDLDQLSVIHVAGTKGKGSTCVFCEQLLLHKGYRIGLFTSPHLISVKERFRINGKVISDDKFVFYFWSVYNKLLSKKSNEEELPAYFMFLTVMAYTMFVNEKVDVAIIETGIGGEYDCTNILRKTSVVGISSLGFDHTTVLGNTLQEIAWQKSGIMKPNSVTIVANDQPIETHQILIERSVEKQTALLEAPPFNKYNWYENTSELGVLSTAQEINASLAIQLANAWINRNNKYDWLKECKIGPSGMKQAPIWEINKQDKQALRDVKWHGRNQVLNITPNLSYFLDGAHTIESIQLCSKWYQNICSNSKSQLNKKNILIFNVTALRDYSTFLNILFSENKIDLVLLCPIVTLINNRRPDTVDMNFNYEEELAKCHNMKNCIDICDVEVFNSIHETVEHVKICSSSEKNINFQVLVTGSLKLVGGVLEVLQS